MLCIHMCYTYVFIYVILMYSYMLHLCIHICYTYAMYSYMIYTYVMCSYMLDTYVMYSYMLYLCNVSSTLYL